MMCEAKAQRLQLRNIALTIAALAVLSAALTAQENSECLKRTIIVNVRDHNGNVVIGVSPASFRASQRKSSIRVQSININSGPRRVLLLLDLSGSVTGAGYTWKIARLVASDVLKTSPNNQIALMTFSDQVWDRLDFTSSPAQILRKLEELEDGSKVTPRGHGRTAFFDALVRATEIFGAPQLGDVVYAVTDGGDNSSHLDQEDAEKAMLTKGVRFFAFYAAQTYPVTEESRFDPLVLSALAESTGGTALDVPDNTLSGQYDLSKRGWAKVTEQLRELYDLMNHFYLIDLVLPTGVDKKGDWELELVDDKGKRRKDLYVIYPHKLVPCPTQAPTK